MTSLKDQLAAIRRVAEGEDGKPGRISPEDLTVMHRVTADQRASGFRDRMPAIGDKAPSFTLGNQDNVMIASSDLQARGPVVVSFFRGQW